MKRRTRLYLYLLLNVIISAATTLAVLVIWDRTHRSDLASALQAAQAVEANSAGIVQIEPTFPPAPTETLPSTDQVVIQITSVVGVGDLEQEVVLLKRLGAGNLRMAGWKLQGEHDNTFVFPTQPELVLYQDGAVQVYTKPGTDTATDVFWNRTEPAWRSGETIRLVDAQGNERAKYQVP